MWKLWHSISWWKIQCMFLLSFFFQICGQWVWRKSLKYAKLYLDSEWMWFFPHHNYIIAMRILNNIMSVTKYFFVLLCLILKYIFLYMIFFLLWVNRSKEYIISFYRSCHVIFNGILYNCLIKLNYVNPWGISYWKLYLFKINQIKNKLHLEPWHRRKWTLV